MKSNWLAMIVGALALATPMTAVLGQPAAPIELKGDVKVDRIVIENGQKRHVLEEPKVVVPGDRLIFATAYHNAGSTAVKDFVVTNPVPAGVMLAPENADTPDVSVDGGKSWGKLAALTVPDGQGSQRAALASDVTHLRWTLATLAPGARGTLTYNAIVR